MKRKLFGSLAVAAMVVSIGSRVLAGSFENEEAWFYVEDTGLQNPIENPGCSGTPMIECARKYERSSPSEPWTPVSGPGTVLYGLH